MKIHYLTKIYFKLSIYHICFDSSPLFIGPQDGEYY